MHKYTHEYKMVNVKNDAGKVVGKRPAYVGSRCATPTCPDNRRPTTLDTVKRHNDDTHGFFGTTGNTRVVKGS